MNNIQKQVLQQCLYMATEGTALEIRCADDLPLDVVVFLEDNEEGESSLLDDNSLLWDEIEIFIHDHYRSMRREKRTNKRSA